ncbi:hypothetical protein KCP69_18225 [Salmonella enterica subsp. enterica]|nr:hypothetical protein KCP69_18225 [Salmonella enterica subsp. enterica]
MPVITLLLTLNGAGAIKAAWRRSSRYFDIGFPLTLTVGIMLMAALMPLIAPFANIYSAKFSICLLILLADADK